MLSTKTFFQIAGTVFSIVGTVHFFRLFTGWEVNLAGWSLPVWVSLVGVVGAWYLAYNAFVLAGKGRKK